MAAPGSTSREASLPLPAEFEEVEAAAAVAVSSPPSRLTVMISLPFFTHRFSLSFGSMSS